MLSKIVQNSMFCRSLVLRKCLSVSASKSSTTTDVVNYAEKKENLLAELNKELPKPYEGPERDYVNFPRPKRLEAPGKVRFAVFPDEWFTFFHKKTGVTGPYVFGFGFITFLLSKELYVIEEELSTGVAQVLLIYLICKNFGPQIKKWYFSLADKEEAEFNKDKEECMQQLEKNIETEKTFQFQCGIIDNVAAAKRENVHMQLDTEYRRRLMTVYDQVKKRLDYHVEILSTRRKLEQRHMVEWIVDNVFKSITPQQEKEALQKCLVDLKALASRA